MYKTSIYILIFTLFAFQACIDETPTTITDSSFSTKTTELLVQKFEAEGDYINSPWNPALVKAQFVYDNITQFMIVDIRSSEEFSQGRIPNSINVKAKSLLDFMDSNNSKTIVIVSASGQHAAYCTSILRLLKYKNVYSMNFGIGIWNSNFSHYWENALDDVSDWFEVGNQVPTTPETLPTQPIVNSDKIDSYIKDRAKELLNFDFIDGTNINHESELTIDYQTVENNYYELRSDPKGQLRMFLNQEKAYVICYGNTELYLVTGIYLYAAAHPPQTVVFRMLDGNHSSFRTSEYLQNIPNNKKIFIYSFNGQRSAYITAYLRMLGYNAKSIIYGACNMLYPAIKRNVNLRDFTYRSDIVNNFEFETE